jgi:putative MATE family efflux protein
MINNEQKIFYDRMLSFAIPIVIQTLITSSLNMVDSVMVGQLGVDSIAAVGIANKVNSMLFIILSGFATGAAIFSAQYWGKKDRVGIGKVMAITLVVITTVATLFMGIIFIASDGIINLFSNNQDVILLGANYLYVIAFSYIATGVTILFQVILRSMGEVKGAMYINVFVIVLNTLLNYIFIFGNLGAPALGVSGAAIATVFARIVQCVLLFMLVKKFKVFSVLRNHSLRQVFDYTLIRKYVEIAIPSVVNHVVWTLGEVTFIWLYAFRGTDVVAAVTLVDPLIFIFMAVFIGISDASSIMVGNNIGAKSRELAFTYAKRFLLITFLLSILASLGILLVAPHFLSLYNVTPEVVEYASSVLFVYALIITPRFLNMVNNMGVLRAGGDTKFVLYLDLLGVWLVGIPVAAISIYFGLPLYLVFFLANSHEIVRMAFGVKRTVSKKWLRDITEDNG